MTGLEIANLCRKRGGFISSRLLFGVLALMLFTITVPYIWIRITSADRATTVSVHETHPNSRLASLDRIRIATLNIAHGRGAKLGLSNWAGGTPQERQARLTQLGALLARSNLDIVILNEVDFEAIWSNYVDQAEAIAHASGFPYVVRQRNVDVYTVAARLRFGNAVLSKFRVIRAEYRPLPALSSIENAVAGNHDSLFVELEVSETQRLGVWAVHLEVRDEAIRRRAIETILTNYPPLTLPTVLLGDLNSIVSSDPSSTNLSAANMLVSSGQFTVYPPASTSEFFTFPSQDPRRTLDWIFIPKSLRFAGGEIMKNNLTDHHGVVAEIALQ